MKREDAFVIALNESWEVDYWTEELGVSESELRQAIKRVGNRALAVREYLKQMPTEVS
ncbi:MAG: DUF3606 domain-containing protein [Planctomycetaceae bacterium]|nr:DUF3606 domain-containing protein [Planctomycetaceae bacterium]